ncbi:hypothetical protein OR1_01086 [Geobacter sp. OR-1]|uniref:hypothetical protein n=1 Tax=Geobacter sp. OR-1 TaxID=1266765 RepID=UPI00054447D6|nr:hypothetical protein [Geobacter sp. OR-1]GAM08812.1 hypothetical protein OR1_01086 [Geobacter sp. OR-1]
MNKLASAYLFIFLMVCTSSSSIAAAKGDTPPIDAINAHVSKYASGLRRDIKVVGLHKQREGAYLVITNWSAGDWGGPYEILKLESGQWVIKTGDKFEFVSK